MEICKEMIKLRKYLDKEGIEWLDGDVAIGRVKKNGRL